MALPLRTVCVLLFACCICGCGGEEPIRSYSVPRPPEPKRAEYRILVAIFPDSNPTWFFKFNGSTADLAKHEADWDKLITSVKYKDEKSVPEFVVPTGWAKTGPRGKEGFGAAEVLKIGNGPLEVTISLAGGGLQQNLARWADQLDMEYDEGKLVSMAPPFAASGGKGLRVDFRGPKNPAAAAAGPMMKR